MRDRNQNQVSALNISSMAPYHIVISIAQNDITYKSPSDIRYKGWRPIWVKCWTEWFGFYISEKMRNRYCEELIEHVTSSPMISMLAGKLKRLFRKKTLNSERGTVVYVYYTACNKEKYRVGVELIKRTTLPPGCSL